MVDDSQYLGAWVNDTMKNFKHWCAKAWTVFWKLKKIWHSNADIKLKIKFSMHQFSVFFSMQQKHM